MTERERFYYHENREIARDRQGGKCKHCAKPGNHTAHRVIRSKINTRKYGLSIINHHINLHWVCSLRCNSKSIAHGLEIDEIIAQVRAALGVDE